ncbi:translocation protein SEC63 homolog isoform X1 [Leguminivora glycinivorella]|uniref:translocation protein SEC63 homolog isoform X1 n=1 Tax=Leguminivora glycinivorella TaxID=1035111 RepID=UPI00200EC26B|nr:translocation protein SEC63 homolog isoform X1 [Leguminivora glycinivorella]
MGGQKFEYDESGSTFFYFVLSFLALILVPATFYYWPRKRKEDPAKQAERCQCPNCIKKQSIIEQSQPYKSLKNFLIKLAIISGWVLLAFLAYKVSQFDYEMSNFDPYEILGLPPGATQAEIKKSYRKQSLILHPDKETGDEKAFMKLTKAYQALTDDEARRNWEKYGNPDGPGAMSFGIALPSWIVEKENSVWVLGLYALVFMVALPTVVGTWWYRSIRYSGEQVLLDTTQMYFYFCHKTPSMPLKRALMILAASCEFDKRHNSEIVERITDNEEVPMLLRELPNLGEKNKEQPLCRPYSIKARALLHAHLSRLRLPSEALDADRRYIVGRCPDLIVEMVNCVNQLIALAYARRIPRLPTIETIENCMKLSPMIVQGLWEYKSPLLQLPYITEDHLKYFTSRKKHIKSLLQLAQLPGDERRQVMRFLNDKQYDDVIKVLGNMPYIHFQVNTEVIDDENSTVVTAGAIVTVTVFLRRTNMKELFGDSSIKEKNIEDDEEGNGDAKKGENDKTEENDKDKKEVSKRPVWMKQQNKRAPAKKGKKAAPAKQPAKPVPEPVQEVKENKEQKEQKEKEPKKKEPKKKDDEEEDSSDESSAEDSESHDSASEESRKSSGEDDDQWDKFQKRLHKRERLEGRSRSSHPVHCPYYPQDKQEYWWCYICDRKSHTLLTAPAHVTALLHETELQLRFTAPRWPQLYTLSACLRSDSYIGMDQQLDLKLDVKEAAAVPHEHPQWDLSDTDSDNQDQGGNESEFTTDDEVEEE